MPEAEAVISTNFKILSVKQDAVILEKQRFYFLDYGIP